MLAGGDGYSLGGGSMIVGPNVANLLATVVTAAVQQQKTIAPVVDGRITEVL